MLKTNKTLNSDDNSRHTRNPNESSPRLFSINKTSLAEYIGQFLFEAKVVVWFKKKNNNINTRRTSNSSLISTRKRLKRSKDLGWTRRGILQPPQRVCNFGYIARENDARYIFLGGLNPTRISTYILHKYLWQKNKSSVDLNLLKMIMFIVGKNYVLKTEK